MMTCRPSQALLFLLFLAGCSDQQEVVGTEGEAESAAFALTDLDQVNQSQQQQQQQCDGSPSSHGQAPAFDHHHRHHQHRHLGSAYTGKYRNLFREIGYSRQEIHDKLDGAFQQMFHGDAETQAVYYEMGSNENGLLAQIRDIGNGDVRSEGMSYGMMIAVQFDRQAEFDALWNWAQTYMRHADPANPAYRYYSWSLNYDGTVKDELPAPDGEEYFATALYFAAGRWGNRTGIYNYRAQANEIVDAMKNRGDIGDVTSIFNLEQKQVRFTPNKANFVENGDHTDPSYHLPAFYELWARWGNPKDRQFWLDAAEVSRDFFVKTTNPTTGLAPDYANFDGTPKAASWEPLTVNFRFDAWRTAMNWSVDWAWFHDDPREVVLSNRIQTFFESQGLDTYFANYTLDGQPIVEYRSGGLIAMNAVASLAATNPQYRDFVQALWDLEAPSGQWRYYDGMLYLMALLHTAGDFRIYSPDHHH